MSRDQILLAAAQIFRSKGFHAASMQDIAEAVNLQKASLYHHVASKQEILLELLDRGLDVVTERLAAVLVQPLSPEEKLRQAIASYLGAISEHRDLAGVLLLEYRSLEPALQARHIPRRDRFERLWRDLISEGLAAGAFTCEDPVIAARALLGIMNWTITWYRPEGSLSVEEITREFANLFLQGLQPRRAG
jgi:AcrR family transcriptional regulator